MIKWILYFVLALVIVYLFDLIFSKKDSFFLNSISIFLKLILALVCAFLPLGGPIFLRPIQELLVALYIVLLGDALSGVIFLIFKKKKFIVKKLTSFIIVLSIFLYGTINSSAIKETKYEIKTDKVSQDYSFIFMSDIHVGSQDLKIVKNTIEELKTKDIDFLVLGGDITDDYTTKEEMVEFYSYFKGFNYPVYMIYGNHDLQLNQKYHSNSPYTKEELLSEINKSDIIILQDEFLTIDELMIFGRDDKSLNKDRTNNSDILFDKNKYSICFDHQTSNTKGTDLPIVDLQVSGHTHAGQFSPLRKLYDLFVSPAYGMYEFNETKEIVSSGLSGWRVPFKNEAKAEYVLVKIVNK